ncbi:hypothetical protein BGZ73_000517, partial [Actinomortierella ambigua]
MLRPWGRKYVHYDIDKLVSDAGLSRSQFQVLLSVSNTDYSRNIPGLGIATNTRIIKAMPTWDSSQVPIALRVDFDASRKIYIDGTETLLSDEQKQQKRALETRNLEAVLLLKRRMGDASVQRRSAIKQQRQQQQRREHSKNTNRFKPVIGKAPPSLPSNPPAFIPPRQGAHWQGVLTRRMVRPHDVSQRANACKQEHQAKGFDHLRTKRYVTKLKVPLTKNPRKPDGQARSRQAHHWDAPNDHIIQAQLFGHLTNSRAIAEYLHRITGNEVDSLTNVSPGWLLTRLVTPVGQSMHAPASRHPLSRTTTTATVAEMRALAIAVIGGTPGSSSEILMNARPLAERVFPPNHNLEPGQPHNLLPSFLLRGMIVTDGRKLYLSAIDLRKKAKQRYITKVTFNPVDNLFSRQHVLAPDNRRLLPSISTAIPSAMDLHQHFPDLNKVDVGAIDLGKAFMVGFACHRHDSPGFLYTIKAKTKAAYQPTNRARKEAEAVKVVSTVLVQEPSVDNPGTFVESRVGVQQYELSLSTLDSHPATRISEEDSASYNHLTKFYNGHGRQQKQAAQASRARK